MADKIGDEHDPFAYPLVGETPEQSARRVAMVALLLGTEGDRAQVRDHYDQVVG